MSKPVFKLEAIVPSISAIEAVDRNLEISNALSNYAVKYLIDNGTVKLEDTVVRAYNKKINEDLELPYKFKKFVYETEEDLKRVKDLLSEVKAIRLKQYVGNHDLIDRDLHIEFGYYVFI